MPLSCLPSEHTDMATLGLFGSQSVLHSRLFQLKPITELSLVRWASKKAGSSSRNRWNHGRPKHRGWKVKDGGFALAGKILVLQRTLRFHPGLNVGFGRNGTLFALEAGRVMVTCEKVDLNWEHSWVMKNYEGRTGQTFYKKYYNVIPEPQHNRFKLIDKV